MQRTIQQITQRFVERLPENDQFYRLEELHSWGIPSFIVHRVRVELQRNLAESMNIPKTDWANTKSDAVLDAWQRFVDAIRAEARLPASYGKTVIETAVADVVEMLVQPRKNIPAVIFGNDDELSLDIIQHRLKAVVVYRHFGKLIPRYMQKKGMETLTQKRCVKVISNADAKLTQGYSPLNWAQMLEPLFNLVEGNIDTNLLRLFFEDKNMPRVARKFDLMNNVLTRAEFIEVLSSPDLLNFEGYEDDQSTLFEQQSNADDEKQSGKESAETETEDQEDISGEASEANEDDASLPDKDQISDMLFPDEDKKSTSKSERDTKKVQSNSRDRKQDRVDDKTKEEDMEESDEEDESSLNDVFREGDEGDEQDEFVNDDDQEEIKASDYQNGSNGHIANGKDASEPESQNGHEQTESSEKTPIWMRYMSDKEIEEYQKKKDLQEQDDEDGFIEDPIIDLTQKDASDDDIEHLMDLLETDLELFVEEIFRGSERAFDQAVEEIAVFDSWSDASQYIHKDIFKRNLVDVYSEAAVDFTDRLQTYFLEKQNQNK